MTLWVVRAGRYGEREELALGTRMVVIGWEAMENLVPVSRNRKALAEELRATYPISNRRHFQIGKVKSGLLLLLIPMPVG